MISTLKVKCQKPRGQHQGGPAPILGVKEALPMVMACDLASDGQERDLKQGPMTARKAEADG